MNIALFGGSFDPPHLGHDNIVKMALSSLKIDKLIIMPTYINPFKSKFCAPPALRLKWIDKIWGDLDKVEISDFEICQNRPVPTIESVRFLQSEFSCENFYLLIGADHLATLHLWDEFDELCARVKFVIASRNHIKIPPNLAKFDMDIDISSSQIRQNLGSDLLPCTSKFPALQSEIIKFYQGKKMEEKVEIIARVLNEKKAENVEIIDMQDKDYIAKFVVIATMFAPRHALALIDDLKVALRGEHLIGIETSDDWSVIDYGDVMVHLMSENYRAKYNIEEFLAKFDAKKS